MIAKLEPYLNKLPNIVLIWVGNDKTTSVHVHVFKQFGSCFWDNFMYVALLQAVQGSIFLVGTFGIKFLSAKLLNIKDDVSHSCSS